MGNNVSAAGASTHQLGVQPALPNEGAEPTSGDTHDDGHEDGHDMDIAQAANVMGIPVPTLRKRLQRGTQPGFKSEDGTWRVIVSQENDAAIDQGAHRAVGRTLGDAARRPDGRVTDWAPVAQLDRVANQSGATNASIDALTAEIRELREEIERNSALLESTQWQIAQINPPGQFQNLQNHTETLIENQLRPVVSALMAVLDYLDRERADGRKASQLGRK